MTKRRLKLIAARLAAGYEKQSDLVDELRKQGVEISLNTYRNIECGRNKTVDASIAFAISKIVKRPVEEIFNCFSVKSTPNNNAK